LFIKIDELLDTPHGLYKTFISSLDHTYAGGASIDDADSENADVCERDS
jgi:hypothetical protein